MQRLDPERTTWHITFGTYGTRLHGDIRPTVDRNHNRVGTPFLTPDSRRRALEHESLKFDSVYLTREQCLEAQARLPEICSRGGWTLRVCSASSDHVHLVLDIVPEVHGEKARRLIKRWLGEALTARWPRAKGASWWAEEGSNKAVKDEEYLNNAYEYVLGQRTR